MNETPKETLFHIDVFSVVENSLVLILLSVLPDTLFTPILLVYHGADT